MLSKVVPRLSGVGGGCDCCCGCGGGCDCCCGGGYCGSCGGGGVVVVVAEVAMAG